MDLICILGGECDDACKVTLNGETEKHCWGEGPDMCQKRKLIKTMTTYL